MNIDNMLEEMLEIESLNLKSKNEGIFPQWVSKENSSFSAYSSILLLRNRKLAYIKANSRKAAFIKKNNYTISKSEVARSVGKTPQSMFNTTTYSKDLTAFFISINEDLQAKAAQKQSKLDGSHTSKRKVELISIVQSKSAQLREVKQYKISELMQLTLNKLSLDVKRKLGI